MTDLHSVLPDFSTAPFSHLIPSLDKAAISTSELLACDALDIARKAQLPTLEVRRLTDALIRELQGELTENPLPQWDRISVLDDALDAALGGGIPLRYVTEITGER